MVDAADRYDRRAFLARGASAAAAVGLAGVGVPVLLSGCGSTPSTTASTTPGVATGKPRYGGTVTIGVSSEIDGFLPSASHFDNSGLSYANTIFDTLTVVGADGTAHPYLARSVTPNSDKTVWTITLRPGILFHDGSPLNADVLLANIEALRSSALTGQAYKPVTGTAKVSDMAVAVTCSEPLVPFPHYLATQLGYVIGMAQLESQSSTKPIGTGPFSFVSWEPNDHLTLTRNEHYWRKGLPYLDGVTYRPIAEDQSRYSSLLSGTVDMMVTRDPNAVKNLRGNAGYQQVADLNPKVGQPDMDFIILNTTAEPTNDPLVRQALAHATNSAELVRLFGAGITQENLSLFPPNSPYRPADNGYPAYDLTKAKQLVAQAAPNHGGSIKIALNTITDPRLLEQIQAVANMWELAGIQTTVGQVEQVTFIDNLVEGKFQAYTDEMFGASDPDLNYVWLSSTTASGPIALNFARYQDAQLEAALQQGRTSSDQSTRIAAYQEVDKRLGAIVPYIWVNRATWSISAADSVLNFDNLTLPDGTKAQSFHDGVVFPTPIWRKA
ncbi:MAG TPA: ABC transporter substrate-binding protein [Acidimicrobiales bacterium]|nr:ABC transporter substrate-binding protein [Acidimicrobiales bacterium]